MYRIGQHIKSNQTGIEEQQAVCFVPWEVKARKIVVGLEN